MFTQTFKGLALVGGALALGGCGLVDDLLGEKPPGSTSLDAAEKTAEKAVVDNGSVACALSGEKNFSRVCQVEQTTSDKGLVLTVRHPDGGFRKLQVVRDGRGVIPFDGADPAVVSVTGEHEIEVAIAGNKYRLPASLKSAAAQSKPKVAPKG